jgi:3-hydroxyisobutyrate dehydrogenase
MMTSQAHVGFIGLGAMGDPMARHLHRTGHLAAVANRTGARARALADELGVAFAADAAALAERCDIVVSCVTADADVIGIAQAMRSTERAGLLLVDTSTIASSTAREAASILAAGGGSFVDAPVSGGVEGARNGRLSVMVGGAEADVARATPVLEAFAARITHMGPVGAGQDTKAVNQVLVAGVAEAVCEGLALGKALGLERDRLLAVLTGGAANSWFLEKRGATMWDGSFSVGFKQSLLLKDLRIVRQLEEAAGTGHAVVDQALADYTRLVEAGHGDNDISGLIRLKHAG